MRSYLTLKRVLIGASVLACYGSTALAQTDPVYIDGMYVGAGSNVYIAGNAQIAPTSTALYIENGESVTFAGSSLQALPGAQIYGATIGGGTLTQGSGTGTISFAGTTQQTLDGGGAVGTTTQNTFPSITVNNTTGVKLVNTASRIGSNLNFTAGHLYTDVQNMALSGTAVVNSADATKYVVTAVAAPAGGHLVREAYTGSFVFPVGMADADYTPATINPAAANTIYVNVTNYVSDPINEVRTDGIDRVWNIYGANAGTGTTAITLQHNASTNQGNWSAASNFVTQYGPLPNHSGDQNSTSRWQVNTGGASTAVGGAGTETNSRTYAIGTLATSAPANQAWFTKASNRVNPLPVSLIAFSGQRSGSSDKLYWTTASEQNMQQYELQYSTDAASFGTITTVMPTGNGSTLTQQYQYTHTPVSGNAWYRLKMVENNGTTTYSKVVAIVGEKNSTALINEGMYPVPFSDELNMSLTTGKVQDATVSLCAIDGKMLMQQHYQLQTGSNVYTIRGLASLPAGMYILHVQTVDNIITTKVNKR